jgi:hypothetical protein
MKAKAICITKRIAPRLTSSLMTPRKSASDGGYFFVCARGKDVRQLSSPNNPVATIKPTQTASTRRRRVPRQNIRRPLQAYRHRLSLNLASRTNFSCWEPPGFGCLAGLRVFAEATGLVFATDAPVARGLSLRHHDDDSIDPSIVSWCHLQLNRGAAHLETDFAIKSGAKSPFCS